MTNLPLWALLGFVTWTLVVLLIGIGMPRIHAVLTRRSPPKFFRADVPHGSERYQRAMRAHMNCVENLPLFAALVLTARAVGLESTAFDGLAGAVLPARIAQSVTHIASGTNSAVLVRFCFFTAQLVCMAGMIVLLAGQL